MSDTIKILKFKNIKNVELTKTSLNIMDFGGLFNVSFLQDLMVTA